jgi:hypothetical protein
MVSTHLFLSTRTDGLYPSLNIGRSGTPMRDSRAEIDTERLTKELAEHGGRKEDIGFIGESILRRKSGES